MSAANEGVTYHERRIGRVPYSLWALTFGYLLYMYKLTSKNFYLILLKNISNMGEPKEAAGITG